MFKKPVKIGAQNQLSGKDRKTIKAKLTTQYDAESIEALLKADKIICSKVTGSKMLIYIGDDYPLFVDGTGKEDFFPSVYTCTAYEPIAKTLTINEGVESYIFNGANLMWPGVRDLGGLGTFKKDQVVSIKDSTGHIVAVGAMGCSYEELKQNTDGGGIAVYILHYKGDRLWDMGNKQYPEAIIKAKEPKVEEKAEEAKTETSAEKAQELKPKKEEKAAQEPESKGKKDKKKDKEPVKVEKKVQSEESDDDDLDFGAMLHSKKPAVKAPVKMQKKNVVNFQDDDEDRKGKKKNQPKKAAPQKKKEESQQEEDEEPEVKQEEPKKGKGKKGKGKKQGKKQQKRKSNKKQDEEQHSGSQGQKSVEEQQKPEKSAISGQLMDQYFKEAFLNVLKLCKIQGELPIDSGRFFSDYMVFARSDDTKLQIKDSTFKKLGRFYEEMAKQKFIQFKPAKQKKGQQGSTITKILWSSDQLKNYIPTIKKLGDKEVQQKTEVYSKEKIVLSQTVQVDYVYKLTDQLKNILLKKKINYMPDNSEEQAENDKVDKEVFLTEKELKEKIEKYINDITIKEKDEKKEEEEQKGKKVKQRKVQKLITLSYKDNPFIHKLLKKEIDEFEENLQHMQTLDPNNDSDEEEGKKKSKKDKHKKNMFKIERGYLVNKIFKLAHPYYNIADKDTGLNKFKQGTFKGVQIIADKIMNKNVTKILNLEAFIPPSTKEDEAVKQIHGFAHQLQLKFASSANVVNLPGKNAGKEIVIQGNFADELEGILVTEYGLKKEYITIQNKLGKKKKN